MVRQKWLIGIAIVIFVVILEIVPQVVSGRSHIGVRAANRAVETSLVVLALSLYHHWATRRHVAPLRMLGVCLGISATVGALCGVLLSLLTTFSLWTMPRGMSSMRVTVAFGVVLGLVQCGVWALGFIYPSAMEDARLRALEAETLKLEAEKLRGAAELARLRSQLEPHFLLNTLNAIAGLVTQKPKEARRLLACLGDLLRDSLRDPDEMVALGEEVDWLRRYAEILESRHSGELRFRWAIADDSRSSLVPRMILQPLVENAVKHGALLARGDGEVTVTTYLDDDALVCTVEDNGPGLADVEPRSGAFGLRSVRRRLELKFDCASLAFESPPRGTRSVVRMPRLQREPHPAVAG